MSTQSPVSIDDVPTRVARIETEVRQLQTGMSHIETVLARIENRLDRLPNRDDLTRLAHRLAPTTHRPPLGWFSLVVILGLMAILAITLYDVLMLASVG